MFQSAAEPGQVDSQYNTAYQYQYGLGVEQNVDAAIEWYEKAAAHGHALSQVDVANLYASLHTAAGYEKARHWYEQACEQNCFKAYRKLGDLYFWGLGCQATVQRRSVITGRRPNRGMTLRKQSWEWV